MVNTYFLLENLWISESSLAILETFQCRSALPNKEYNFVVLYCIQFQTELCIWIDFGFLLAGKYFLEGFLCWTKRETKPGNQFDWQWTEVKSNWLEGQQSQRSPRVHGNELVSMKLIMRWKVNVIYQSNECATTKAHNKSHSRP